MRKIAISVAMMSSLVFAGGGMKDVEPAVEPVVAVPVAEEVGPFYVGLALSAISSRDSSVSMDFFDGTNGQDRLGNVTFLAGYNFNAYFALEGRYTTTFSDEDLVEMDGWSLFVKPQYPVSEDFSVYALLGYGGVNMDGVNGSGVDVDDSGFQWGLGMGYAMTENFDVFVDYTSLAADMDGVYYNGALKVDADAITLGVNYNF